MSTASTLFGEDASILQEADFQLLLLANIVAPLGTALVSPLLDSLQHPYGASDVTIGLMMTAFTAPAVVVIPLVGVLADYHGRKFLLVLGLFLFSIAGVAMAFTTDFLVILGLRFCQGIGFAAVTPTIITSIGDLYTGSTEATGQGFRFASSGLTQTLFPLIGGLLVVIAWQYPLFLYAIGIPIALILAVYFEEPADNVAVNQSSAREGYIWELLGLVSHPRIAAILVVRTIPVFLYITFMTYISLLVGQNMGGSPGEAGALVALASVAYAGSATQTGRASVLFKGRAWLLIVATIFMTVGLGTTALAPSVTIAALGVLALGLGFGVALSLIRSIVTGFAPTDLRGGLVSLSEAFGRLSATIAPVVVGALIGVVGDSVDGISALQTTIVGVAAMAGLLGLISLVIALVSPSIEDKTDSTVCD